MECKCKNCKPPDRHPGCHSTCQDYILFQEFCKNRNKTLRNERVNNYDICEGIARLEKRKREKKPSEF